MSAGGPGDHPITDIVLYNLPVYGEPCDGLIKDIANLTSVKAMYEMFDWCSISTTSKARIKEFEKELMVKLLELKNNARLNGWEIK
jgi:hypothetical protein